MGYTGSSPVGSVNDGKLVPVRIRWKVYRQWAATKNGAACWSGKQCRMSCVGLHKALDMIGWQSFRRVVFVPIKELRPFLSLREEHQLTKALLLR
jgi:hypothetical protein